MEGVSEREFELYHEVVPATYRFHDQMLGRLVELAGDETAIVLCSDHGYHTGAQRPPWTPRIHGGPAVCHRDYGIVAIASPDTKQDERVYGASILDITPTVLTILGLPVGADMDGRVLAEAFDPPLETQTIPSWEAAPGACGMHPAGKREDPWEAHALLKQLENLGYLPQSAPGAHDPVEVVRLETQLNLSRSLMDAGQFAEALPFLEAIYREHPEHMIAALALASCYQQTGQITTSRKVAEEVIARSRDDNHPAFGRPAEPPEIAASRTRGTEGPRLAPQAELLLGMLDLAENRADSALQHFERAEQHQNLSHHFQVQMGRAYLGLRRWPEAERAFRQAIEIDPDAFHAHDGLAEGLLEQDRLEEAAEEALAAVGLIHHYPRGHYHLGVALARLGMREGALQAFRNVMVLTNGRSAEARQWLHRLHSAGDSQSAPELAGSVER
jgi:tetratricopeptide (TPR) repeat protein